MRLLILALIVGLRISPATAQATETPHEGGMIEILDSASEATLVVDDETGSEAYLVPASTADFEAKISRGEKLQENGFKLVFGARVGGLVPVFTTLGGRLGVAFPGDRFEAGLDAGIGGGVIFGFTVGAYANLAPIPGDLGKRFYINGKAYRAYGLKPDGQTDLPFLDVTEAGLGYRNLTPNAQDHGRYWYIELTLLEAYRKGERAFVSPIPGLTVGMRFTR